MDIAGLVKGASRGEGLGNQFLAHIREVDAIAQVVRCFVDENVTHVDGSIDPVRDIEIINMELQLADLATIEKRRERQRGRPKAVQRNPGRNWLYWITLFLLLKPEEACASWN